MRIIDADSLMDDIKRDSKKAIDEGDKVGSFWLGYAAGLVIKQPTIQPEKAQLFKEGTTFDTISRQQAIDIVVFECGKWTGLAKEISKQLKQLPPAQPEPSILLSWVEKYIEWLRSLDNEFAKLAAAHISVMVKKWRDEQDERTD